MRALIGQLLFAHWWMVTKASARSKPYAPLSARLCFYYPVRVCKDFSLNTEKKFTKTLNENVKLRRRICCSAKLSYSKEKNIRKGWFVQVTARKDTAITSFPCYLWATLWIPDSRFWISDSFIFKSWISVFLVIRTWIQDLIVIAISDSLGWNPDSKAQDSRFQIQRFQIAQTKLFRFPELGFPYMGCHNVEFS